MAIFNLECKKTSLITTSFSAIDLQTRIDDKTTGIVFPFKDTKAEYHPSFSSIVRIQNNTCYIACSEYRIITHNVETGYANYSLMPSITFNRITEATILEKILQKTTYKANIVTDIELNEETSNIQENIKNIFIDLQNMLKNYKVAILIDKSHHTEKVFECTEDTYDEYDKLAENYDDYDTWNSFGYVYDDDEEDEEDYHNWEDFGDYYEKQAKKELGDT